MRKLMIDPDAARDHIQSNWPNDPLLRTIGLNLVDTLPKVEVEIVKKKECCKYCLDGEPFATHIDGKAEIVKITPLPAIDLNTGEQEDTVEPPFAAIWVHSQDNCEDFVPIEFCPKCGRNLKEEVGNGLAEALPILWELCTSE